MTERNAERIAEALERIADALEAQAHRDEARRADEIRLRRRADTGRR